MRQLLADLRALGAATADELTSAQQHELHQRVSENAATVMAVCQNGLAALGHLLAHGAPVIEDGTVGADSVEALGWLMAEVGDLAATCAALSAAARRTTSCS
ncbi:hypothetical protein ACFPPF_09845 [Xenophilus aerolatus]|nr:hypothetical protein [Xenophilus aerolatus]